RAERTADEAGDLVGSTADLALAGLAPTAGVGAARQHLVLGGDPSGALSLEPAGHAGLEGCGHEDPGAAELDEHRALGVVEPVAGDAHLAQLLGGASVVAGSGVSHPVRLTRTPRRTLTAVEKIADIDLPGGATTVLHAAAAEDPHAPVVLVLPAMGVPAGYYGPFVDELARTGVTAAAADYTGQAESRPRAGRGRDLGYDDLAHGWLPAVVAELRRERPGPVVALGHSLGGHLLAAHLSDGEPVVDAGVLIGSGTPHWRALHGLKTLAQAQLIGVVSRALGYWPGERLGFGGTQPRTLIREWAAFSRTGRLAPRGRDVADGLRGHSLPLLVVDLEGDTLAPR